MFSSIQFSTNRFGGYRVALAILIAVAVGLAATAGARAAAIPANTTLNDPPAGGRSVLVFSVRDFVSTAGFLDDDRVTVNVIRNGVAIGTAADVVPNAGLVEVNHPGGACWDGVTPDIIPGDVVRTTITANATDPTRVGIADQTTTQNLVAGPTANVAGQIVVHGTAVTAAGTQFGPGELESRLVSTGALFTVNGKRTVRALLGVAPVSPGDGALSYDAPGSPVNFNWTATYALTGADIARALAAESRIMWLGRTPAALNELTIYENGQAGGPAPPCTAPAAKTAITGVSQPSITKAYVDNAATTSPSVVVSGVAAAGVSAVSVAVPGGAARPATITPAPDGVSSGTWSAPIPATDFTALPDGSVTITASYTGVGAPIGDTTTLAKDTIVPATPVIGPPTGSYNTPQTAIITSEPGSTVRVTSGAAPADPTIADPVITSLPVSSTRTVKAIAVDAVGNLSAVATSTITIDTTAPVTSIDLAQADEGAGLVVLAPIAGAANATFSFSANEPAGGFECRLDAGTWTACSSPVTRTGLSDGPHTFSVRATDLAGNVDAAPPARSWTIDVGPPDTSITGGPSAVISQGAPSFSFSSSKPATFECRLDGPDGAAGSFAPCTTPKSYAALADGSYQLSVRASTSIGGTDPTPATRTFTIDTIAPDTALTGGPVGTVAANTAAFTAASDPGVTYECQLDGAAWSPCAPAIALGALAEGSHTLAVRARDGAGNVDASPAARSWVVDTVAPETVLNGGPSGTSTAARATFSLGSDDPTASFECRLDSAVFAPCDSLYVLAGLTNGSHAVLVRAVDPVGNADPTPAVRFWIVKATQVGITINGGDAATNDPHVTITVTGAPDASELLLANDGGMTGALSAPLTASRSWTLASAGPERLPKTVYARLLGGASVGETYQDDIVLDQTPPVVTAALVNPVAAGAAVAASRRLTVRAHDNASGIAALQIAIYRSNPRPWRSFDVHPLAPSSAHAWVRVRDRAGNPSRWRAVTLAR